MSSDMRDDPGTVNDHAPVPLSEELRIEAALTVSAQRARMLRMAESAECLERALLARTEAGVDGDWYTSDFGSHVVDFDQDTANQLSILLKKDGTVTAVSTRNGKRSVFGQGPDEVADVIRSWATHPQDASGDAERTKALLLALIQIRDSTYRNATQLRGMANDALERDRTRPVTAMQAKEAK